MPVAEYLAIPEEAPYLEYLDGEVVQKVAPDFHHMVVTKHLIVELAAYEREYGGVSGPEGRVEFRLGGGTFFRLPDVDYWAPGRPVQGTRAMNPPTLAIEVSSPGQAIAGLRDKCRQCRAAGVEVCWLFNLDARRAEVFDATNDGTPRAEGVLAAAALPGFQLALDELFALLEG